MSDADRPVFEGINLVSGDVRATLEFYEKLGVAFDESNAQWALQHRSVHGENDAAMDVDSEAFASTWNEGHELGRRAALLNFRFSTREAVDAKYAELTGIGYQGLMAPYDAFWGSRFAVVADPDGNEVALKSPADPAFRVAPPDPPS